MNSIPMQGFLRYTSLEYNFIEFTSRGETKIILYSYLRTATHVRNKVLFLGLVKNLSWLWSYYFGYTWLRFLQPFEFVKYTLLCLLPQRAAHDEIIGVRVVG